MDKRIFVLMIAVSAMISFLGQAHANTEYEKPVGGQLAPINFVTTLVEAALIMGVIFLALIMVGVTRSKPSETS